MGASHFFVGLGAGIAMLTVPVLTLGPGLDLPHRFASWIEGPPRQTQSAVNAAAASRPERGYKAGDPTPTAEAAPPTVAPIGKPTAAPTATQQPIPEATVQPANGSATRTGVIRGGGVPVIVRRAAGVERANDPQLADGSPVLVSAGSALQVRGQAWRAVRGLNGVVGWVPSSQVVVDGETPPQMGAASSVSGTPSAPASQLPAATSASGPVQGATPAAGPVQIGGATSAPGPVQGAGATPASGAVQSAGPTPAAGRSQIGGATSERLRVANTDGVGVVLRNSPRDADKSRTGLMDGMSVGVMERSGADWVRVRADNGQEGWVPARYVVPTP